MNPETKNHHFRDVPIFRFRVPDFHQNFHFYATFGRRDYEIRVARPDFLQNEPANINFRRFFEKTRNFEEI